MGRTFQFFSELDSGLGKGCHCSKWEIKRRYQFGEGSCGFTFNNLSAGCHGMLRWKWPTGSWHATATVRREAGLRHLILILNALKITFPAPSPSAASGLSQTRLSSWRAFTHCVCHVESYSLFMTHLRVLQETFDHPHWKLVPNFLNAEGHFFFCSFYIVL